MKSRFLFYVVFLSVFGMSITSCSVGKNYSDKSEHLLQATLWQQNSAEYRALCYQAFNIAKLNLDQFLQEESLKGKKLAIITDIDETVLDNSPSTARQIINNEDFSQESWHEWTVLAEAEAVPGAADFLNYAEEKGVEIFYISNRMEDETESTIENMKAVNFPYADRAHLLLRAETSSKQSRFEKVGEEYTVIMFMGDNLSDFTHEFRAPSTQQRNQLADDLKGHFGVEFIVLPNPMYGDWETKGVFKNDMNHSTKEMRKIRMNSLKSF